MYWRTGRPVHLQMFRFWRRIFAVGFAIGVVRMYETHRPNDVLP